MANTLTIRVEGMEEARVRLREWNVVARDRVAAALLQAGEAIESASKQLVPVQTGTLRASGYVEGPAITADLIRVTLGYGGAAQPYAHYQHQGYSWQSGYTTPLQHPGGGQSHFLIDPAKVALPGVIERVAAALREATP